MNRVSIIMTSYNHAHFLPEAINSVLGQTHKNWELIIVDDGSSDNSIEIIDQYIKNFPSRISRYIHPDGCNKGLIETYRLGFKKANAEFIAFLESDDIWLPDNLKRKLEFFNKFGNAILVYSEVELFGDPKLAAYTKKWIESVNVSTENTPFIALPYLIQRQIIPTFSSAVIRNLPGIIKNFVFPEKHIVWLDWWLWTQLSLEGEFIFIQEKLAKWRKSRESFNAKFVEEPGNQGTGCSQYTDVFLGDLHSVILHKLKQKKLHFAFHLLEKIMNARFSMKSKRNEHINLIAQHNQIFKEKCDEFALLPALRNAKLKELKKTHDILRSKLENSIRTLAQKDGLRDWHLKIKDNKLGRTYDRLTREIEKMEETLKTSLRCLNHLNNFSNDEEFSDIENLLREKTTENEKLLSAISRKSLELDTECNILKETISIKDRAFATLRRIYEIKKYELSDEITRYDQIKREIERTCV